MKLLLSLLPVTLLAACSQEPAPAPAPTATATVAPTPSLPSPDQALFSEVFAKACPEAKKVNTAICKRAALGSDEVICDYGLGEDSYTRNSATLQPGDGAWTLKDADTVCKTDLARPKA